MSTCKIKNSDITVLFLIQFLSPPLLALLATIKVFGVLPAHCHLLLDAGTVFESVPLLIDIVNCHGTQRWAVLDNTHCKESGAFC